MFKAAIAPTATMETATAMNASCAVVNDPLREWVLISDIATTHRRIAERITRNRNEYRRKVVRGSMVAVECTPEPGYARPVLPCYWAAFGELEEWVERKNAPPGSTTVPHPTPEGEIEDANSCSINEEATYTTPPVAGP